MRAILSIFVALIISGDLVQSVPTEVDASNIPGLATAVPSFTVAAEDVSFSSEKQDAANMKNDFGFLAEDEPPKWTVTCNTGQMTYYWAWFPMVNYVCERMDDSLNRSFVGQFPEYHLFAERAKSIWLTWNKTGDKCQGTCKQVFNTMRNTAHCRAEEFWIKELMNMTYEDCGEASFFYEYHDLPALPHGRGLCWDPTTPNPLYTPDQRTVERFCIEAVNYIHETGNAFSAANERLGFFWTDYNRQVARPDNSSVMFDTGFVHFWIKALRNPITCLPGRYVEDEIEAVTIDRCLQRFASIESMACGAPLGTSNGGRFWADCFEWGIEASGYNGIRIPV